MPVRAIWPCQHRAQLRSDPPLFRAALQPVRAPHGERGAAGNHQGRSQMIEITESHGRYEVLSPGRHWEAFHSRLEAHAAALALAAEVEQETGRLPQILAPWPLSMPAGEVQPPGQQVTRPASTGDRPLA